jgi:protoporphyrinogen/coproporphyrinogen III oxidase
MDARSSPSAAQSDSGSAGGPRVVVIGGGIAGLSAARAVLDEVPRAQVTVFEAGPRVGGKLRLGEVAGHPVDLGAEAMLSRRPEAVELTRAVGLGDALVDPITTSAGVWSRGAVHPLPRTVMGVPADLDELAASGIVGRRAVPRARIERGFRRLDVSDDVAVGRLVAHRLGREIRDRLVEPLLGGVYAGRADELSLHATIPQLVPAIEQHGSLLAAAASLAQRKPAADAGPRPQPVFAGIDGGVGRLATATEEAILAAGARVRCLVTVRELSQEASGFRLVTGPTIAPELVEADAVIVASPAAPAARLLGGVAPHAAVELGQIDYASMAVVTLALEPGEDGLVGSGFLVPPVDGRDVKAATFSSRKWGWHPPEVLLVRCSLGRYGDAQQLQYDDAELVASAVLDLREAVGVRGRLIDAVVTRWGGALPQYAVGHLERVRRVREAVSAVPCLAVWGAAYDGVGLPACIASGVRAATQVADSLRGQERMSR